MVDARVEVALVLKRGAEVVVGVYIVRIELDGIDPVPERLAKFAGVVRLDPGVEELDGLDLQRIPGIRRRLLGREL